MLQVLTAILAIGLVVVGCQKPTPIPVGVLGTFSGSGSDLSVSGRRGAELAAEVINREGGIHKRKIQLFFKDDANDPQVALNRQAEFAKEGVKFIIGPFTSGMAMAVLDKVNGSDQLLLGPTISADSLSGKDDHFIRFIASTKEQASVLAQAAFARKHQSIMVVYDIRNKGFTDQLVTNYASQIKNLLNISPVTSAYDPSKAEMTAAVFEQIKTLKPEALFVVASAEECARMAQQVAQLKKPIQLYGPLWANTQELIRKGGTAVNGMILVGGIDQDNEKNEYKIFKKAYEEHYGEAPTFASMYTYETLMALAQSMKSATQIDAEQVKTEMLQIGKFEGVQNEFALDSNGDNTRAYLLMTIQDGTFRKVE